MSVRTPSTPKTPPSPAVLTMMSSSLSESTNEYNLAEPSVTPGQHAESPKERSPSAPQQKSPPQNRTSPERVTEPGKPIHKIGESRLFTDTSELLPFGISAFNSDFHQEIVEDLLKHSVPLTMNMLILAEEDVNPKRDAEGQACLVRTQQGVFMVTAKHNFCKEFNKEGALEKCQGASVEKSRLDSFQIHQILGNLLNWDACSLKHGDDDAFKFRSNHQKPNAGWKYGKESAIIPMNGPTVDEDLMKYIEEGKIRAFEAVSTTFECLVGMEVGIMACSASNLLAKNLQEGLRSEHDGYTYEAQQFDTFITVGYITHVGTDHIEYTVNTVGGVSGGPVFLLSAGADYHMKLIAIHAGFSEDLETNFGFLLAKEIEGLRG